MLSRRFKHVEHNHPSTLSVLTVLIVTLLIHFILPIVTLLVPATNYLAQPAVIYPILNEYLPYLRHLPHSCLTQRKLIFHITRSPHQPDPTQSRNTHHHGTCVVHSLHFQSSRIPYKRDKSRLHLSRNRMFTTTLVTSLNKLLTITKQLLQSIYSSTVKPVNQLHATAVIFHLKITASTQPLICLN